MPITLCGLQYPSIQSACQDEITKEARQGQLLFAIAAIESSSPLKPLADDIRFLIGEFQDLFEAPTQLLLHRGIDHHITLKDGTNPINVRPYHSP